jgi:hypothetical protein
MTHEYSRCLRICGPYGVCHINGKYTYNIWPDIRYTYVDGVYMRMYTYNIWPETRLAATLLICSKLFMYLPFLPAPYSTQPGPPQGSTSSL